MQHTDEIIEKLPKIRKLFFEHILFEKKNIQFLYVYAVLGGLLSLSLPLGIQTLINQILAGRVTANWYILITSICICVFLLGVSRIAQLSIIDTMQRKLFVIYSYKFYNSIEKLKQLTSNHEKLKSVKKFYEIITLQKSFAKIVSEFSIKLFQILFGLILLCIYNQLFIVFGLLVFTFIYFSVLKTYKTGLKTAKRESDSKFITLNLLENYSKDTTNEDYREAFEQEVRNYSTARIDHFKVLFKQAYLGVSIKVILTAIMLILGSYLLLENNISLGQFLASEIIIITMLEAVEKLILSVEFIYDLVVSIEKLSIVAEDESN